MDETWTSHVMPLSDLLIYVTESFRFHNQICKEKRRKSEPQGTEIILKKKKMILREMQQTNIQSIANSSSSIRNLQQKHRGEPPHSPR